MNHLLVDLAINAYERAMRPAPQQDAKLPVIDPVGLKKANNRVISYTAQHRSQFFKPEFDFGTIQIAETTESLLFRAIHKKVNRFLTAGWEFVGENSEAVDYIKRRIAEIERVSNQPWKLLMYWTIRDMFRFSNCIWVKVRNEEASSGERRRDVRGVEVEPVAGYFIAPMETLRFKTKDNGDLLWIEQRMKDGNTKQFNASDIIHFHANKNPGFAVGTPELFPVLDDIGLLRRIEENVEELIESALFPFMHYKIGTDDMPERYTESGLKESDIVRKKIEYMPSGGIWISDHRHQIESVGAEGRALRVEPYLEYFKKRVLAGIGISSVDLGEGDTANKSTASSMSKAVMLDIEAMQCLLQMFIDFFVIDELLMEGGYNPVDKEDQVHIQFGVIDKEQRLAFENSVIQKMTSNLITVDEARRELGKGEFSDEDLERTHYKLFAEPASLAKAASDGSAASHALAEHPASSITPEGVSKGVALQKQMEKAKQAGKGPNGRPATKKSGTVANKARPSNGKSTRSAPKLTRDLFDSIHELYPTLDSESLNEWKQSVHNRHDSLGASVSIETVATTMLWRLEEQLS